MRYILENVLLLENALNYGKSAPSAVQKAMYYGKNAFPENRVITRILENALLNGERAQKDHVFPGNALYPQKVRLVRLVRIDFT